MKSNSIIEYSVPEYSSNMVYGVMGNKSGTPILPKSQKNYISTLMNELLKARKRNTIS